MHHPEPETGPMFLVKHSAEIEVGQYFSQNFHQVFFSP